MKATINPPGLKRIVGPGVTLVLMALRAGIGAANAERNIGSRYTHAVIAPRIDGHVDLRWHVASNAGASSTGHCMAVMRRCVVSLAFVALGADGVSFGNQLIAVGVVAVAAYHACLRHLALHEGSVNINLIKNLPVVPIQRRFER